MITIYYCLLILLGIAVGPLLLATKKKARVGLLQKLGQVPPSVRDGLSESQRPIWIHAVSVGEFNAVWPLIQSLKNSYPKQDLVVSTSTGTGQELAKQRCGSLAKVVYFPFDVPWAVSNWLDTVRPKAVIIAETEIWPGFYAACKDRGISVVIVNGRMSPRSFRSYYSWRLFFAKVLGCVKLALVQSEDELKRYKAILPGLNALAVGNLKYDGLQPISQAERRSIQASVGVEEDDFVIVAGSTHEGEELALLNSLKSLQGSRRVRLIIAPRHPERFQRVTQIVESQGYRARTHTQQARCVATQDVYILDTIGLLSRFYSLAAVAFVGGTLVPIGGHNVAEPCAYAVPVVCGSHLEKAKDAANALKGCGALISVQSQQELNACLNELYSNPNISKQRGESGREWLERSQGAVNRTLVALESLPGLLVMNTVRSNVRL